MMIQNIVARFVALLSTLILTSLVLGCSATSTNPVAVDEQQTDDPLAVWDFTMQGLDGETYTLSDLRGQWVIVNFWATWCVPCVEEMPELQAISEDFVDDLIILGINQREDAQQVADFIEELGVTFPILLNPPDFVLQNYQVLGLPQTIVFDPDGELVWRAFGAIELDTFSETPQSLMIAFED